MSFTSIDSEDLNVGKPLKKELFDTISANLEDLNSRVGGIESVTSGITFYNGLVKKDKDQLPVGSILWSTLSEAQFNAEVEDGEWQLVDGTATSTTDDLYTARGSSTAVPDLRGRFLRMSSFSSGNDPAGSQALDTYQADNQLAHTHTISNHTHGFKHVHGVARTVNLLGDWLIGMRSSISTSSTDTDVATSPTLTDGGSGAGSGLKGLTTETQFYSSGVVSAPSGSGDTATTTTQQSSSGTQATSSTGTGAETRPKAIVENAFIKINRNWIQTKAGYLLFRATQNLVINQVVLTPVTNGTSGTLELDIKKGDLGSISTSIFTTKPSVDFDDTDPDAGLINATNATVTAGQYIQVDITEVQSKLSDFHLLISASPSA